MKKKIKSEYQFFNTRPKFYKAYGLTTNLSVVELQDEIKLLQQDLNIHEQLARHDKKKQERKV